MTKENKRHFEALVNAFDKQLGIMSLKQVTSHIDITDKDFKLNVKTVQETLDEFKITKSMSHENRNLLRLFLQYCAYTQISKIDFEIYIFSFCIAVNNSPLEQLFDILYKRLGSTDLIRLASTFTKKQFIDSLFTQAKHTNKNACLIYDKKSDFYKSFNGEIVQKVFDKIDNKVASSNEEFKFLISEMCKEFKTINLTVDIDALSQVQYEAVDKYQAKPSYEYNEYKFEKTIDETIDKLKIEQLLNPELAFINSVSEKYSNFLNSRRKDKNFCSVLKTILYLSAYLGRNKTSFEPCQRMKNITSVNSTWATDTEKTFNPSFYGNSELAKAFSSYYAFMNGKRNPYYKIINNKTYDYMDEQALRMHKYFKDHDYGKYFYELLYEKKVIGNKSIVDTLVAVQDLMEMLEKPIVISTFGILSEIKSIVSSLLNSVAQILDLSMSLALRQLFYIKFIPINNHKYSLADIYNYASFLKLIFQQVDSEMRIEEITREDFVNAAYSSLGINQGNLSKIGYCSYDPYLNDKSGLNIYGDKLYKNLFDIPFSVKRESRILYSLIQYGILKTCYKDGNNHFYYNFDYGSKPSITSILNSLTSNEMYYIFKLYAIDILEFKKKKFKNKSEFDEFNKNLKDITANYDHTDISFYINSIDSPYITIDTVESEMFANSNFGEYLNLCVKQYFLIVEENKRRISEIVFEENKISNIDDFVMRFLPSITEVLKLTGTNNITIQKISEALDYICYFLSDVLFRNVFIKIKFSLADRINSFKKDIFNHIGDDDKATFIFNLELGGKYFKEKISEILDYIDNFTISGLQFDECFNNVDTSEFKYDPLDDINIEPKVVSIHNEIEKKDTQDSKQKIEYAKAPTAKRHENIITSYHERNKKPKLIYKDGEIFIQQPDGTKHKVVNKTDYTSDTGSRFTTDASERIKMNFFESNKNKNYTDLEKININDKTNVKNIKKPISREIEQGKTEYEVLINIRDYIHSIKDKEIVDMINKQNEIISKVKKEQNKKIPNNYIIQSLKKEYSKLTEDLEYAKSKNDKYVSVNASNFEKTGNQKIGTDFVSEKPDDEIVISSNYTGIDDAINKSNLLKEVHDVVVENNLPLTNYEIIQLLK